MPDVDVQSRVLTREELAEAFRGNQRLIRAFEALGRDVAQTLPAATGTAIEGAAAALGSAASALSAAINAQGTADGAQSAADAAIIDAATAISDAADALTALALHEALTSAHGVTGNVVGTTDTQTLSGKTLDGATPLTGRTIGTGTAAPVLTANKPGASTAVATWLTLNVNGTDYVVPLYLPT